MNRLLKILLFAFLIKPLVFIGLGLNIRGRNNLPLDGPSVIAANHNSHLDTMVMMALYPLSVIHRVRPVAAADYFLSNKLLGWFSLHVIGIIPLDRSGGSNRDELFSGCHQALDDQQILLIFPEGSRGKPEQMTQLKKGIYHLIKERTDTPVTPIVMHGLGRALPKGEAILVPFNCDVIIGEPINSFESANQFSDKMASTYEELLEYCITRHVDS